MQESMAATAPTKRGARPIFVVIYDNAKKTGTSAASSKVNEADGAWSKEEHQAFIEGKVLRFDERKD